MWIEHSRKNKVMTFGEKPDLYVIGIVKGQCGWAEGSQ
jgi:hypothetical protein